MKKRNNETFVEMYQRRDKAKKTRKNRKFRRNMKEGNYSFLNKISDTLDFIRDEEKKDK